MRIENVRAEVRVARGPAAAFDTFVHAIDRWWPKANTFSAKQAAEVAVEPRAGGQWYERAADGTITPWGDVLSLDPPRQLVLTWGISPEQVPWVPEPDPARRSVVSVGFEPDGAGGTRVTLVHGELARHGAKAQQMADAMASAHGWPNLLQQYRQVCEGASG